MGLKWNSKGILLPLVSNNNDNNKTAVQSNQNLIWAFTQTQNPTNASDKEKLSKPRISPAGSWNHMINILFFIMGFCFKKNPHPLLLLQITINKSIKNKKKKNLWKLKWAQKINKQPSYCYTFLLMKKEDEV